MSLVSVIIPNHNYARYVAEAVESILAQTYTPMEIIVVDNGSTDNSLEVLQKFGDRIRLVAQENRGQSGARNRGIAESRGEFIAFCDADDTWLPEKLEKQMKFFQDPSVGLVYCGYFVADKFLNPIRSVLPRLRGNLLSHFAEGAASVVPAGESSVVIRKTCLDKVGGFDSSLSISAGFDLYRRISQYFKIDYALQPLIFYRQHGANATLRTDAFAQDHLRAIEKMFDDEAASEIQNLKSSCYGRAHISIAGAYFQNRKWKKTWAHLMAGISYDPTEISYVVTTPLRVLARRWSGL